MNHRTPSICVGTVNEVKQHGAVMVSGGDRPLTAMYHQDQSDTVDNRCQHRRFP